MTYVKENPALTSEDWAVAVERGVESDLGSKLDLYYGACNCVGGGMMKMVRAVLYEKPVAHVRLVRLLDASFGVDRYIWVRVSPTTSLLKVGKITAKGVSHLGETRAVIAALIRLNGVRI